MSTTTAKNEIVIVKFSGIENDNKLEYLQNAKKPSDSCGDEKAMRFIPQKSNIKILKR